MSATRAKIAFIGSVSFLEAMSEFAGQLEALGAEVRLPQPDDRITGNNSQSLAAVREQNQFNAQRLEWADVAVIVNEPKHGRPEYIGPNSLIDMGAAFVLNKPMYTRYPVSDDSPYALEVAALTRGAVGTDIRAWLDNLEHHKENN